MKTADLITSYLNNEMTPEQERRFLLSVAASDSLRLSLKSHFMLDKIVAMQAMEASVPESLRTAILTQASASVGVESRGARPQAPGSGAAARAASRFGRIFGRGAVMALMMASGFAAGFFTRSEVVPEAAAPVQQMNRPADHAARTVTSPAGPASAAAPSVEGSEEASLVVPGRSADVSVVRSAARDRVANRNLGRALRQNPVRQDAVAPVSNPAPTGTDASASSNQQTDTDNSHALRNSAEVNPKILKPADEGGQAGDQKQEGTSTP